MLTQSPVNPKSRMVGGFASVFALFSFWVMFLVISAPMKFKFLMHARFIDLEKREKLSGQLLHLLRGGSCLQTNSCAASQEGSCLQTNSCAGSQSSSCLQTNSCARSQSSSCLAGNYQLLYLYRVYLLGRHGAKCRAKLLHDSRPTPSGDAKISRPARYQVPGTTYDTADNTCDCHCSYLSLIHI